MKNESQSERKQTITLTIGPKSLALLEARRQRIQDKYPGLNISLTPIVAALTAQALNESRRPPCKPESPDWLTLGQ